MRTIVRRKRLSQHQVVKNWLQRFENQRPARKRGHVESPKIAGWWRDGGSPATTKHTSVSLNSVDGPLSIPVRSLTTGQESTAMARQRSGPM